MNYIKDCFESLLIDDDFLKWLVKGLKYKPLRLKQLLAENKCNRRNFQIVSTEYQNIHNFWLRNSINSNESMYIIRRITKGYNWSQFDGGNESFKEWIKANF